jgi:proline iminopeptidase
MLRNRPMWIRAVAALACLVPLAAFAHPSKHAGATEPLRMGASSSPDLPGHAEVLAGGVKMIDIQTPKGQFRVWTKRVGQNPKIKVLLLHGGPAFTHEYLEVFDSYFPGAGIEYYYYDQLGSAYSDQPDEPSLWEIPRFVDEVEQVRKALNLDKDNFYLFGHSWGGVLAIEYALAHQDHLAGLIVSNMMSSGRLYNDYANHVLLPEMDPRALAEIEHLEAKGKTEDPRYMELVMREHYVKHILRMPVEQWPEPLNRAFKHYNPKIYVPLQGTSELRLSGKLQAWDRTADLGKITVPTLVIGARYDTMDPRHMEWMSKAVADGYYLYSATGSHLAMYDDQETYFSGLISFIKSVSNRRPARTFGPRRS